VANHLEALRDVLQLLGDILAELAQRAAATRTAIAVRKVGDHFAGKTFGMRRGEVLGLRWVDVDRKGNRILLPQTKNGEGRIVYLNRIACDALDSLPGGRPADFVFSAQQGVTPEAVSMAFSRACRIVGIEDFRLHDLRHTAASWLRMQGADIHTVAQLLGHKDLRMAARYQHLSPAFLAEAVAKLDTAYQLTAIVESSSSQPNVPHGSQSV
jgi:integrase